MQPDNPGTGVSLADLVAGEKDISVSFGEKSLSVTYDPQFVTGNMIDTTGTDANAVAAAVSRVVKRWDLVRPDGTPWPLDVASLAGVPFVVLGKVLKAIVEDQTANPL